MENMRGRTGKKKKQQIYWLWHGFLKTLETHPDFKLSALFQQEGPLSQAEQKTLILLLGRELGHIQGDEEFF